MSKWISTKESLPESNVDVIIYYKPWDEMMVAHIQKPEIIKNMGTLWFVTATENTGFDNDEIEFWMPLPEAPKL